MAIFAIAGQMLLASEEMELRNGGIEGRLKNGYMTDVTVKGKVMIKEFGRAYVNSKGKHEDGAELGKFFESTEKKKERGDKFVLSKGIMTKAGQCFIGEFGHVWICRKSDEIELDLHPTYFQPWGTPDEERPWHMDFESRVAAEIWGQSQVKIGDKYVGTAELKDEVSDVREILLPVKGSKYLQIKALNMNNSFRTRKDGNDVIISFSDDTAQTTWYYLTDCPSVRLSLEVVKR